MAFYYAQVRVDPKNPERVYFTSTPMLISDDGGVAVTWDRGGNYDFLNTLPPGQFYAVSFDMAVPYTVCGGRQDNGSWCGPRRRRRGPITSAMWYIVGGGDGFYTAQDPTDPNTVYAESQGPAETPRVRCCASNGWRAAGHPARSVATTRMATSRDGARWPVARRLDARIAGGEVRPSLPSAESAAAAAPSSPARTHTHGRGARPRSRRDP